MQVPRTLWGRIFAVVIFVAFAGCALAGFLAIRTFFLHDARFTVGSSSSIQTAGNAHLSRPQLLSVFGEDVERNIFNIPLAARRAELESLPWVEHATVMRLLPNHLRIAIVERTPVAFVRQGSQIGLVDASGVLLDMPPDAPGDPHYSFPVITGIAASDPLSTRAARMRLFAHFSADLDSGGEHLSQKLSEVDLSNPEDVKALIPEGGAVSATDVLVHFGDSDFLGRYKKFEQHLPEWRAAYPKLASVDMRYERQVVLEMQSGSAPQALSEASVASAPAQATRVAPVRPVSRVKPTLKKAVAKPPIAPAAHTPPAAASGEWHMVVVKPHSKSAAISVSRPKPANPLPTSPQ